MTERGAEPAAAPADVPEALADALRTAAAVPRLLIALDFDGTLAPHVDDPMQARALPRSRAAVLRLLELPDTPVALVSGRPLDVLDQLAELPATALLVGSHGAEARLGAPAAGNGGSDPSGAEPTDGVPAGLVLSPREQRDLAALGAALDEVTAGVDGAWVEGKPGGFAIHTRLVADAGLVDAVHARARRAAEAAADGLTVRDGKDILEFSLRADDKGRSIQRLREHTAADAVFFAGDDVTDEDGFAALRLGDVGVKCGPGPSRAQFRVAGPAEVAAVLELLGDLRAAGTG